MEGEIDVEHIVLLRHGHVIRSERGKPLLVVIIARLEHAGDERVVSAFLLLLALVFGIVLGLRSAAFGFGLRRGRGCGSGRCCKRNRLGKRRLVSSRRIC